MSEATIHLHPAGRLLALVVHARNRIGIATYQHAGFLHNGQYVPGGRAGPQLVMLRYQPAP